ncbi:MAG: DUF4912 domain-containing protein [Planctomycetaceae bacterium]|nr:DUF4912 domain-containing protein [Planctomycetaceae bacterium]
MRRSSTLYTAAALKAQTVKDLGKLAEKVGVEGWRSMRKDELVRALVRAAKRKANQKPNKGSKAPTAAKKGAPTRSSTSAKLPKRKSASRVKVEPPTNPRIVKKIQRVNEQRERQKNLAATNGTKKSLQNGHAPKKDRVVLLVRDAYWLQACWELLGASIERARAAMAEQWHTAKPIIRLVRADTGNTTSATEQVVRDIEIHGGVKTWYIDIPGVSKGYRCDIGYLATNGKFYSLARSNSVTTPRPSSGDSAANDWSEIADNCEKIYALSGGYSEDGNGELQELFEERLGRRMGSPAGTRFGMGADKSLGRKRDFEFDVDAEMIVYGVTKPNAHVTLAGTPVKLQADGSFSARLSMPDRRQVLPVVASSPDGVEQRTVVLAVERNTKVMEPKLRESSSSDD